MITYLFHSTLLLSAFTLFYWSILRYETYFKLNRWVILGGIIFCISLPLVEIPSSFSIWQDAKTPAADMLESIANGPAQLIIDNSPQLNAPVTQSDYDGTIVSQSTGQFSLATILTTVYMTGVVIFMIVFLVQLIVLMTQRYNLNSYKTGNYRIIEMVKDSEPFSFFNYIFINPETYDSETYEHIIEHEKVHINQSHFVDKIIAELLVAVFWFNPFTWLLRKSISQNLEFLTDQSLLNNGIQKEQYQLSLLKVSVHNRPLNLTASYNSSFLKNRINMMNAKNSSVVSAWKYLFIIPLFILSVVSLNAVYDSSVNASLGDTIETEVWKATDNDNIDFVRKELELPMIGKLALGLNGNVILSYGTEQKITIEGPAELLDQVDTTVNGDNWRITYLDPNEKQPAQKITVRAQLTRLTHLALSGNGDISAINEFPKQKELYVALSGVGNIDFSGRAPFVNTALSGTGNITINTEADNALTALSGSGNITIKGKVDFSRIAISGSGSITANELLSKNTVVAASGTTAVSVHAIESLDVSADGSSVVTFQGNPEIIKDLKDESKLIQIE